MTDESMMIMGSAEKKADGERVELERMRTTDYVSELNTTVVSILICGKEGSFSLLVTLKVKDSTLIMKSFPGHGQ